MATAPLACGNLIGLGDFKSDPDAGVSEPGDSGGGGGAPSGGQTGSGGTPSKPCQDDQTGSAVDKNCDTDHPFCDGDTGLCQQCQADTDCDDSDYCTEDSCNAGACKHDALTGTQTVSLMSATLNNGSFEETTFIKDGDPGLQDWLQATGWEEEGGDLGGSYSAAQLTFSCSGNCSYSTDNTNVFSPTDGSRTVWLGGLSDWQDRLTYQLTLPLQTTALTMTVDINIWTAEAPGSESDTYSIDLLNAGGTKVDTFVWGTSANSDPDWYLDYETNPVTVGSSLRGKKVGIRFSSASDNDDTTLTDFVFDNVRIDATLACGG